MWAVMQRFIIEENIRKFEKLLEAEANEETRLTLQQLLRSARQQLDAVIARKPRTETTNGTGQQLECSADDAGTPREVSPNEEVPRAS